MILRYTSIKTRPVIFVAIHGRETKTPMVWPMVVDTGADTTVFPSNVASLLGHDNTRDGVQKVDGAGIGGKEISVYMHTDITLSLTSPDSYAKSIWTSSISTIGFFDVESSQVDHQVIDGLLGRDIMAEWKKVSFIRDKQRRWIIEIEL